MPAILVFGLPEKKSCRKYQVLVDPIKFIILLNLDNNIGSMTTSAVAYGEKEIVFWYNNNI